MKAVKTALLILVISLVFLTGIACAVDYFSPWSSETKVKPRLLALTPIGSSVAQVKSIMHAQHWHINYEDRFQQSDASMKVFPGVKGTHAIGVSFGKHFGIPFPYGVDAYWGFDENGKLIDLKVRVFPEGL